MCDVCSAVMANKLQKRHQRNLSLQDEPAILRGRMATDYYSRLNHAEGFLPNRGNSSINKSSLCEYCFMEVRML